jgi:hypothetical protein
LNAMQESQCRTSVADQEVTSSQQSVCTRVCTSEAETVKPGTVEALAAELARLPAADRARLVALLLGQQPGQVQGKGGNE